MLVGASCEKPFAEDGEETEDDGETDATGTEQAK